MRRLVAAAILAVAALAGASPAAAHPLGNATVSRAVSVTVSRDTLSLVYVVDMAEIPAFAAILELDTDGDGTPSDREQSIWAAARCLEARSALTVSVAGRALDLVALVPPVLAFPPGVGGLETLRLECVFSTDARATDASQSIGVVDASDDGRRGWREITIVGGLGVVLSNSTAPAASPSNLLTAYPEDRLLSPIDSRSASADFRIDPAAAPSGPGAVSAPGAVAESGRGAGPQDALLALLGGPSTPLAWLLAVALAAGLGAAHAVSPGHGKTLIAAYAIGAGGSLGRAVGMGLTVAVTHTIGVFFLGAIVLFAGELLLPERVVAWLSVGSGILVVVVGASIGLRTLRGRQAKADHGHVPGHDHGNGHTHHDHEHRPGRGQPPLREVLALGLVGGMVPSASALLVLLVAVTTGRIVEGLVLIGAFGLGMALVLACLAAVTTVARRGLTVRGRRLASPTWRRLAAGLPLATALLIMAAGTVATVGALGSL